MNTTIEVQVKALRKELHVHNHRYYVLDQPTISDFEFDSKLKTLQKLEEQYPYLQDPNSPTKRVGGGTIERFKTITHKRRMYSLDNSYSEEDLKDWYERVKKNLGHDNIDLTCELKYDGVSISLIYEEGVLKKAVTRGDGVQGDDVTENIKTIQTVPLVLNGNNFPNELEVRGEIILPIEGFKKMNEERIRNGQPPYMNPRNTASGSLKLQNSHIVAKRPLQCLTYGIAYSSNPKETHWECLKTLSEWGFKVPMQIKLCNDLDTTISFIKQWNIDRLTLPYETDGIVIKVNNIDYQSDLGFTAKSPRWAIAYKYKTDQVETLLKSVSYQVGRTGIITPVANLNPVLLGGTIVKRASLHNADQILKLDIKLNDTVFVEKGGEIIPKIVGVNHKKRSQKNETISYIEYCPKCQTKLVKVEEEANHFCPNFYGCPPQITGRIQHFISRKAMDIDGMGNETVTLLYEKGLVTNYADLYDLKRDDILCLDRMAEKSVTNLINGITKSKQIPFERVLYALGIRFVGETTAKVLAKELKNIDTIIITDINRLVEIDEIGVKIAQSIFDFFRNNNNIAIINRLKKHLNFQVEQNYLSSKVLEGKSFVISGVFKNPRDTIKKLIENNSGKIKTSISSQTNFLVAGEKIGPEKLKKAEKLNIPIIDEKQLHSMLQETL